MNFYNCDLAGCEKHFKRKVPVDNDRNVVAGQVYRHFKGHTVKVLHISQDTETPGQFYVVYECEDGAYCNCTLCDKEVELGDFDYD